jgi:hypothetical protein
MCCYPVVLFVHISRCTANNATSVFLLTINPSLLLEGNQTPAHAATASNSPYPVLSQIVVKGSAVGAHRCLICCFGCSKVLVLLLLLLLLLVINLGASSHAAAAAQRC